MKFELQGWKWIWFIVGAIILIITGLFLDSGDTLSAPKELLTDKSQEYSQVIDNVYRNTKYHFRIKFPEGWEIKTGDGLHIVQKAVNENSTISILVQQLDLSRSQKNISIKDLGESAEEFAEIMTESVKNKFSNLKIIDYGETKIDNEPAYWVEYSMTGEVLDHALDMVNISYMLAKDDTIYTITAGTTKNDYQKTKPIFLQTISSFVLEKY